MKKQIPSAAALALLCVFATATPTLAQRGGSEGPSAESYGFDKDRLARIAPALQEQIRRNVFPGAVTLIAREGQVVHFEAHGFLDSAKTKPIAKDSIFRLASMTKPVVSVAALMLVEEGVIQLNDPITKWLPELKDLKVEVTTTKDGQATTQDVPLDRPIWVQDLLRHTAGFVYAGTTKSPRIKQMYEEKNIEARETDITGDDMLKALGTIPLAHQPGTFWEYSISVDVLGLVLERATGKSLDKLLQETLFDPLGMRDTAFWVPPAKMARLADAPDTDALKAGMMKSYRLAENPAGKSYLKGGAGLVGTAEDYLKFAQMVVNYGELDGKRYLSKKTVEWMLSDHIVGMGGTTIATTGPGYGFGLGWGVRRDEGMGWTPGSKGDAMWAGAWGTSFWIDPKEELVGILMAQGPSTRVPMRMLFKSLVYGAVVQ